MLQRTVPYIWLIGVSFLLTIVLISFTLLHPPTVHAESKPLHLSPASMWELHPYPWDHTPSLCTGWQQIAEWFQSIGWYRIARYQLSPCTTNLLHSEYTIYKNDSYNLEIDVTFDPLLAWGTNILLAWNNPDDWYSIKLLPTHFYLEEIIDGDYYHYRHEHDIFPLESGKSYSLKLEKTPSQLSFFIDEVPILHEILILPDLGHWQIGLRGLVGVLREPWQSFDSFFYTHHSHEDTSQANTLSLPLLLQHDTKWGDLEYNHATTWETTATSDPSIARWGCALTAASGVLRYHGLAKLPDGNELYPDTLNDWLKTQADGYVGEGLLNWIALTRLSKILSTETGTTKLEYSFSHNVMDSAIAAIDNQLPIITHLPGHFVTAYGYTPDKNDLLIRDPWYPFTHITQHAQDPLSTRLFTPSNTDLSYFMIVTPPQVLVQISSETDARLGSSHIESINNPQSGNTTEARVTLLPKPESGIYQFTFQSTAATTFRAEIWSYDKGASVTDFSRNIDIMSENHTPTLRHSYYKIGESEITTIDFQHVQNYLVELLQKHPEQQYALLQLKRIADIASTVPTTETAHRKRLQRHLDNTATLVSLPQDLRSELVAEIRKITP